jgi:hypothetical protein
LFLAFHFLSLLNVPFLSQLLDCLVNRLTHIEVGAPKLRFCVICFFLSGCQQFLGFIRQIALTADRESILALCELSMLAGIFDPESSLLFESSTFETKVRMFWDRSDAIISLYSLIIDLEQANNTEFLSPDQRLARAVLMPSEIVERMLPGLLTLCESATFVQSKLTVFSFIFRPFWNDETF